MELASSSKYKWILFLLLALGAVAVFANSAGREFIWDDEFFIQENRLLQSWKTLPDLLGNSMTFGASGVQDNFYRPVQAFTHFIDIQVFGLHPRLHHLTSLVLLLSVGLVFFALLINIFHAKYDHKKQLAIFLALSVWLFHPLQCEVVAYLSGRGDLLVLLFMGLSAIAWRKSHFLSCCFCILAILSKENGILTPFFVMGCDWIHKKTRNLNAEKIVRFRPFSIIVLCYVLLRLTLLNFQNTLNFYDQTNVLTEHYLYRLYTYLSTLGKSAQLIFFPFDLHHGRSWKVYTSWDQSWALAGIVFFLMICFGIFEFRKKRPAIAFGLVWFLLATLPTSNLFSLINSLLYDHWFLIPASGFIFPLVILFDCLLEKFDQRKIVTFYSMLFLPLVFVTVKQNATWRSVEAQYESILRYEPNSWVILNNLAMRYADTNRIREAKQMYQRSLAISETAQARNNLGNIFLAENDLQEAEAQFHRAIELDSRIYQAHTGLGLTELKLDRCDIAKEAFRVALQIFPDPAAQEGLLRAERCP